MKKQAITTITMNLRWGAFFFVLLFLGIQVMPRALGQRGQRGINHSTSDAPSNLDGGTWTVTGDLNTARYLHTATLLPNGIVLVAGGLDSNFSVLASAELYDPATGTWTATGSLNTARTSHTATLMSNGTVLIAGGRSIEALASAELYDPATGTWTPTGSLNTARESHTAALLSNGMVLVAGGYDSMTHVLASAELYDPVSGSWTFTGNLNTARTVKNATFLTNGMVLVAAGSTNSGILASAELYDPVSGSWTLTGSLNNGRSANTATLLPNGMVLVAGGDDITFPSPPIASAELYDPETSTWSVTGNLNTARELHSATLLTSGMVLAAGGFDSNFDVSASAELYENHPS